VLKAFNFTNRKTKGARQIKIVLKGGFNLVYNLKIIRRIMRKYNIKFTIRKANAYRRMMKATKEHTVLPNLLNIEFKQGIPKKVLLTHRSYLTYNNSKRAYLSTNEIVAHNISTSLKIDIVLDTIDILIENTGGSLCKDAFIYSDQGVIIQALSFKRKSNQ